MDITMSLIKASKAISTPVNPVQLDQDDDPDLGKAEVKKTLLGKIQILVAYWNYGVI